MDASLTADDPVGAFMPGSRLTRPGASAGALHGLCFAAKDLFDVQGHVTSFGHPDWARTHPPAAGTAPPIAALIEAGAALTGKTKTVELAFGLTGENVWHGTPTNPAAPDRFPGGSSCGSAAAVGAGLVDFALGSDTGGSVRIPASYCGLYGLRPSFGAISLAGACALAPSFDTAGWFARDAAIMRRVGDVLLPGGGDGPAGPVFRVTEAWDNADPDTRDVIAPLLDRLRAAASLSVIPEGLSWLFGQFRVLQAEEAWATLGGWITATAPRFGPGVAERFAYAAGVPADEVAAARVARRMLQARLRGLLAGGAILAYPTSPGPAPKLDSTQAQQETVRARTICVTAIAGMAGLPELTIPAGVVDGAPVGLSLVAAPGHDRTLLRLAEELA